MTNKPTQAQIEAAANAMIDKMFAPHELPLDGELWCKYFDTAKAALSAAAEVGQETTMEHIARDIREGRFPQKSAAAEVVEPKVSIEHIARTAEVITKAKRATIERCAQVADSFGYGGYEQIADAIAAAIRALKDKP